MEDRAEPMYQPGDIRKVPSIQDRLAAEISRYQELLTQLQSKASGVLNLTDSEPSGPVPSPAPRHAFDELLHGFELANSRLYGIIRDLDL